MEPNSTQLPSSIAPFLIPTVSIDPTSGILARLTWQINPIATNEFCLPEDIGNDQIRHYRLAIVPSHTFLEDLGWELGMDDCFYLDGAKFDPLRFKAESEDYLPAINFFFSLPMGVDPSIEQASLKIRSECLAMRSVIERRHLEAKLHYPQHQPHYYLDREQIRPIDVYLFIRGLDGCCTDRFSNTEYFVRDYDYWEYRLHNSLKWMGYLCGDRDWTGDGYISIGNALFDFLGVSKQHGSY
jgi:hypothetical protein